MSERHELAIEPGAGGAESRAWAAMLHFMYVRWAERHDVLLGADDTALIFATDGIGLRNECGIHRLVRVSPFDPQARRHTSFAGVVVDGDRGAWDEQVRSYVLNPYQLVKDHRSGVETDDVDGVLDGDIDRFLGPDIGEVVPA